MRPATTYSPNAELGVSTIGPDRLNGRVRNGNGCIPVGNITGLTNLSNQNQALAGQEGVWLNDADATPSPRFLSEANPIVVILAKNVMNNKRLIHAVGSGP